MKIDISLFFSQSKISGTVAKLAKFWWKLRHEIMKRIIFKWFQTFLFFWTKMLAYFL